jgi:hypothetical protein
MGIFYYFSTKSPSRSMHFCQRCRILNMPLWQKSVPDPRNQLRMASWTASSVSYWWLFTWSVKSPTNGSFKGPNPDCRLDGRAVPSRFVFLCALKRPENPTGTNFSISQNLHHLLDRMVLHYKPHCSFSECYPSVLSDEPVDFLLVALSCSSSLSATARLIGDVRVSVLKMFHPRCDTADTHTDISIHT